MKSTKATKDARNSSTTRMLKNCGVAVGHRTRASFAGYISKSSGTVPVKVLAGDQAATAPRRKAKVLRKWHDVEMSAAVSDSGVTEKFSLTDFEHYVPANHQYGVQQHRNVRQRDDREMDMDDF